MGVCVGDLDQRDVARLRTELIEVIAARFAYPAYYDFRAGAARVRPVGAARRQEIASFVRAIILEPLARVELGAPQVRRFLEQVFARYVELNPDLAREPAKRRVGAMRAEIPRAAAEVQRGLVAFAAGAPGNFGAPRPALSWGGVAQTNAHRPLDWARVERGTLLLEAALSARGTEGQAAEEAAWLAGAPAAARERQMTRDDMFPGLREGPAGHASEPRLNSAAVPRGAESGLPPWLAHVATDPALLAYPPDGAAANNGAPVAPYASFAAPNREAPGSAPGWSRTSQPGDDGWASVSREETAPLPAHLLQLNRSLFAGLESGSQSGIFGLDEELRFSDQPTGPQPSMGLDDTLAAPQEIPPDLIALYSEYLRDLQPGVTAQAHGSNEQTPTQPTQATARGDAPLWARGQVVSARPPAAARASVEAGAGAMQAAAGGAAGTAATSDVATTDRAIFAQLRQQLEAYLRQTARQFGIRTHGHDGAAALAALRHAGILDEADLRLAEGILAISERIVQGQPATQEDYRQAFMLYLLYHRRHVGV